MKKIFLSPLLILAFFLVGCNDEQAMQEIKDLKSQIKLLEKSQMIKVENEVVFDKKDTKYPLDFSIFTLKTNKEWLNNQLLVALLKHHSKNKDTLKINNPKQQLIDEFTQKYQSELTEAKDIFADTPQDKISGTYFSAIYHSNIDYVGQRENIATFTLYDFNYIGGAHGIHNVTYLNFDLNSKKVLSLDDLFNKENQTKLKEMLWERYEPQYRKADGNMGFFFATKQKLYLPENFYFSGVGLNLVYPVYEIGSYADGQKELILHWADIMPLINEQYKVMRGLISE
ncbi:RsiV family protein [Pasteurella atlantica]|uniref:RsiV family protein n=2 Tax=Pasteurellaceae TaxID=712 RepID=A0ACC6HJS8_9PAST|nr:RsiV family protein [Pasteurella atlantica]MDP8034245.1 RsiV family protein [Pasteurella atlantica]MDP8036178.1 RsiV family protein [Pasteurella atlantica]MDP8038128.1 RsiV family protein [Pasteurella atlantica]MDP8048483.1 RsiV family protein [Pasteurella atlantica]MDP8050452.1 RsiV family protein [Pasteurella atlantica]